MDGRGTTGVRDPWGPKVVISCRLFLVTSQNQPSPSAESCGASAESCAGAFLDIAASGPPESVLSVVSHNHDHRLPAFKAPLDPRTREQPEFHGVLADPANNIYCPPAPYEPYPTIPTVPGSTYEVH